MADGPGSEPSTPEPAPRVAVVIATRNRRALLQRLIVAVERAVDVDVEVVVVDEASDDDTPELLAAEAKAWEGRLTVVRNDRPTGPSLARNAGLARVDAPWVAFIDDDDVMAPELLTATIGSIRSRPGAAWSFTASVHIDDELAVVGWRGIPETDDYHRLLLSGNKIPASAQGLVVATDLARDLGGYDPEPIGAEDWDFCIRLAASAPPAPVARPLNAYRVNQPSISSSTSRMSAAIERVVAKHAEERRRLGVELDHALLEASLVTAELNGGRRWAAARRQLHAFAADHRPRSLARAGLCALSPRLALAYGSRRRREMVPPEVLAEARAWLDDLAAECRRRGIRWT